MGLMNEYIDRRLSASDLEKELLSLISQYNKIKDTNLFVYVASLSKPFPDVPISQEDYYIICDLLKAKADSKNVDIYIETPGGSGEAAEEIVKFLRSKFDKVSFVISGEAKSAGTIIVLSGDEILMTETGSLGPIDAQVRIGRSIVSAYDYVEWVKNKKKEAEEKEKLNPFDATMIAQISPGELSGVIHSLEFAKELVIKWLTNYKFKTWTVTETKKLPVTKETKEKRAVEIAEELINHSKWRSHGRSIKIDDLEEIGLKIVRVDNNPKLSELVYRIQTVCRLLFISTTIYKIFATDKEKLFKQAAQFTSPPQIPQQGVPEVVEIEQKCPKCGKIHKIYGKFITNPEIDKDFQKKGCIGFPKDNKLTCDCGFEIDLSGMRNEIEVKTGRKLIV
jgi:phage FluMu protein Com